MAEEGNQSKALLATFILAALFFIFGFVTWLNGILIPYLKIACELTDFQSLFVAFIFYISYTLMALPSAYFLKLLGMKRGMSSGLIVMALGTILFLPAANFRSYPVFLTALFIMGSGLALLQTASNPYVTLLGPHESAAKRISMLGVFNKVAGAIAPLILAHFVLKNGDNLVAQLSGMSYSEKTLALNTLSQKVVLPYLVMTGVLLILSLFIYFSTLPDISGNTKGDVNSVSKSLFQFPWLILGAIALFLYVGVEVIAGDTIISYGLSMGIEIATAKMFTTYTMICMIVGYLLGIALIPKYLSQEKALSISAVMGIVFSCAIVITSGLTSIIFVALLGIANAIVWPAIWPLAIRNLGDRVQKGSALLIMAISGGALMPLLWGLIKNNYGSGYAYSILIPAYFFILFYALKGSKISRWRK